MWRKSDRVESGARARLNIDFEKILSSSFEIISISRIYYYYIYFIYKGKMSKIRIVNFKDDDLIICRCKIRRVSLKSR